MHKINAFKQIQIFESMDWKLPEYAHIPLIHSKEGKKLSKRDDLTRINNLYVDETFSISNIEQMRYNKISYEVDNLKMNNDAMSEYLSMEEKKKRYSGEEDEIFCGRFPHLTYCGCKIPCFLILPKIKLIELTNNIFVGPIESVYKTKELLSLGITHILNVSCTEYNKRNKYFQYYEIFINDNHTENAIKFFKITNRFIEEAVSNGKKILVHSILGKSRCWAFVAAYLIGKCNMKYSDTMDLIRQKFPTCEPNDNFLTQLKHYDLEINT